MSLNDDGLWTLADFADADQWHDRYVALLREWNKNAVQQHRPSAMSAARWRQARRRSEPSASSAGAIRHCAAFAEETSLGLLTVRTILDQQDGLDRTTIKQLQRIDPNRAPSGSGEPSGSCGDHCRAESRQCKKPTPSCAWEAKGLK
jgi:hypothetical protein